MAGKTESGFTIVETMIFLGVSGLLLIGLIAGTSIVIQRQRYTDSINTTQGFIQEQFGATLDVLNARQGNEACNASNVVTEGVTEKPGTSDCLILGRALDMNQDSSRMTAYQVVGREPASSTASLTEDQLLQAYQPTLVKVVEPEEFAIPWGAQIVSTKRQGGDAINRLLILRSPRSGSIYTYAYNAPSFPMNASAGVSATNRSAPALVCIRSADLAASSTSIIGISMAGGPEAVSTEFDIRNVSERCGV